MLKKRIIAVVTALALLLAVTGSACQLRRRLMRAKPLADPAVAARID